MPKCLKLHALSSIRSHFWALAPKMLEITYFGLHLSHFCAHAAKMFKIIYFGLHSGPFLGSGSQNAKNVILWAPFGIISGLRLLKCLLWAQAANMLEITYFGLHSEPFLGSHGGAKRCPARRRRAAPPRRRRREAPLRPKAARSAKRFAAPGYFIFHYILLNPISLPDLHVDSWHDPAGTRTFYAHSSGKLGSTATTRRVKEYIKPVLSKLVATKCAPAEFFATKNTPSIIYK